MIKVPDKDLADPKSLRRTVEGGGIHLLKHKINEVANLASSS